MHDSARETSRLSRFCFMKGERLTGNLYKTVTSKHPVPCYTAPKGRIPEGIIIKKIQLTGARREGDKTRKLIFKKFFKKISNK